MCAKYARSNLGFFLGGLVHLLLSVRTEMHKGSLKKSHAWFVTLCWGKWISFWLFPMMASALLGKKQKTLLKWIHIEFLQLEPQCFKFIRIETYSILLTERVLLLPKLPRDLFIFALCMQLLPFPKGKQNVRLWRFVACKIVKDEVLGVLHGYVCNFSKFNAQIKPCPVLLCIAWVENKSAHQVQKNEGGCSSDSFHCMTGFLSIFSAISVSSHGIIENRKTAIMRLSIAQNTSLRNGKIWQTVMA